MVVFRAGLMLDAQRLASLRLNFQEGDFSSKNQIE